MIAFESIINATADIAPMIIPPIENTFFSDEGCTATQPVMDNMAASATAIPVILSNKSIVFLKRAFLSIFLVSMASVVSSDSAIRSNIESLNWLSLVSSKDSSTDVIKIPFS